MCVTEGCIVSDGVLPIEGVDRKPTHRGKRKRGGAMKFTPTDTRAVGASEEFASAPYRAGGRVLIVSNRLPVTAKSDDDGEIRLERSVGGLASGLRTTHATSESWWIGWLGDQRLDAKERHQLREQLGRMRESAGGLAAHDAKQRYSRLV